MGHFLECLIVINQELVSFFLSTSAKYSSAFLTSVKNHFQRGEKIEGIVFEWKWILSSFLFVFNDAGEDKKECWPFGFS